MLNADSLRRIRRTVAGFSALLLLNAFPFMPSAQAAGKGTILVCTQAGGSVETAKQTLTAAGCTVLSEIPCETGGFSVLQVQPNNGDVVAAAAKFNGTVDSNILSAEVTFQTKGQFFCWPPRPTCTPNDPDYPAQYALAAMNWNDARCTLRLLGIGQRAYPRFTDIDTGNNLITAGDEMTNIQQFNFVGGLLGVPEAPFDSGLHGTAVTSVAACRTNNATFLAGGASHNLPVKITSCRISNDGGTIDTLDVIRALTWCVDHQAQRGGPGVINLSLNSTELPTYNGSSVVQEIAKAARKQGDLIVNGSGNQGIVDPSPEKYLRRVLALDENSNLASFSNTGPFKAGAPGVNVITVTGNPAATLYATGTSISCPYWASCVAFVQSFSPNGNAVRADNIVYATADTTSQGYKIPNFNRAAIAALLLGWFF